MRLIPIPISTWTDEMIEFAQKIKNAGKTYIPDPPDCLVYVEYDNNDDCYYCTFFHINQFTLWPGAVEIDGKTHLP